MRKLLQGSRIRAGLSRKCSSGQFGLFDPDREILTHNLFGVDVNAASVEITKLSLWIKTAKRGKALDSLEANVRVGNSLIEDADYHNRAFVWRDAFPVIFEQGGFDIVLGNPPYVRMELIKPFKSYLETRFEVVADRADLYAYFFEQGVRLLKPGTGRLGYISSSSFFRTGSGRPLRAFLRRKTSMESVVDFGDVQIFPGVTTYPTIIVTRRKSEFELDNGSIRFWRLHELADDFGSEFKRKSQPIIRTQLGDGSWHFEGVLSAALRHKIRNERTTLAELYGEPLYGIKTGRNEAFIIDRRTYNSLVAEDQNARLILKPYLMGDNAKKWYLNESDTFLINTVRGEVDIEEYPSVHGYLLPFRDALSSRATKQEWFELQQAQRAYQDYFTKSKIVYLDIASRPSFSLDDEGHFIDCTLFAIKNADYYCLAVLNSKCSWFQWLDETPIASGGYLRLKKQYLGPTAFPDADTPVREKLEQIARLCADKAKERFAVAQGVRRRIPDLANEGRPPKLTKKLTEWWDLEFRSFRAEVKKAFKTDIPLAERSAWEAYLKAQGEKIRRLGAEIETAERDIDSIIYSLFDLTPDEIALIEEACTPVAK